MPRSRNRPEAGLLTLFITALVALPPPTSAQETPRAVRPAHTYSIVARDGATGQLGVAVQSHWFSVGSVVPWAEAGVGAVATQSFIDPGYGLNGLARMRSGQGASETLQGLLAADDHPEVRQVGIVDASGGTAVHTGDLAIEEFCDHEGDGFTVQANLMHHSTVCNAMVQTYTKTEGDLAERLMAALEAAEAEGGDIRGRQSAALLVVTAEPSGRPWADRLFDLRIEDHPQPIVELRRLLGVARAYRHMNEGDERVTRGEIEAALQEYRSAEALLPGQSEPIFWHAVTLASVGRVDESLPLFAEAFSLRAEWRELVPRLVGSQLLPEDEAMVKRILAVEDR
jgi:uncharacterized Ntn-hydrolase superfamily protein